MFGFGKKTKAAAQAQTPAVPAPTAEHYILTEAQQKAFDALTVDSEDFVNIDDVTHGIFRQQSQYISRYMDGSNANIPVLVDGLRVDVDSVTHHEYRIHAEDVLEFVARVRAVRNR